MVDKITQQVFVLMEWHGRIVTVRQYVTALVKGGR
jgi:hypothetical protein